MRHRGAYCAFADAGPILDGGAGRCAVEPCLLSSDCPNGEICDTSQNPFACIGCISGSDCSGDDVCDVMTHTCVPPPPVVDSGLGEDASLDGSSEDSSLPLADAAPSTDGSLATDAATDGSLSGADAAAENEAGGDGGSGGGSSATSGSLAGGACDCDLAAPRNETVAAFGLSFGLGLVFLAVGRRRSRPRRR